ncbi:SIMPL domain-containing protein [Halobacteriales archaeon QS_9_68_42]|nr:MAG: SIMPL domain-containing protein [Halobacteriales archaeon QS_9_68_42]
MKREKLPILVVVVALLAAALTGAALVAPSGAQDPDANADRTVAVDATGEADAAPDRAVVRVAVTAEGDDPSVVRDNLTRGADALREEFEATSISTDQYETDEYRIDERRDEFPPYRGTHRFVVRLDDPQRAGDVIDAAANVSAEVQTVRFTLSEDRRTDLRERAIEDAMGDARSQADTVAANGGLQVTSVVAVDASQQRYRPVEYEAAAPLAATDDGSTSVETGDVSVRYQVRVTYNATRA